MKEKFGSLKVGRFILKLDAPNAPNPANPNAQNPVDHNQDQDQDQNQDQAPIGQVPAHTPVQLVLQPIPAQLAPAGVPQIFFLKLDREEPGIFR